MRLDRVLTYNLDVEGRKLLNAVRETAASLLELCRDVLEVALQLVVVLLVPVVRPLKLLHDHRVVMKQWRWYLKRARRGGMSRVNIHAVELLHWWFPRNRVYRAILRAHELHRAHELRRLRNDPGVPLARQSEPRVMTAKKSRGGG